MPFARAEPVMRAICAGCIWLMMVACGDSTSDAQGSGGGAGNDAGALDAQAGAAGSDAASGDAASADATSDATADAASDPLDFDVIVACDANDPCAQSTAQLIEGSMHNIHTQAARCVLEALRDRTPGRFYHRAEHTFSNGSLGTNHVFLIGADGSALYGKKSFESGQMQSESGPGAERCQLAAPSYFQGCIDALDAATPGDDAQAWECLWGAQSGSQPSPLAWFASCEAAEPSCD